MHRTWLCLILVISFALLALLKTKELATLHPYFTIEKGLKIERFSAAKKGLSLSDQELLELWESILTGRSAPLARWMKETYAELGLKHIFTPSGFHLSAVLAPFLKFFPSIRAQLLILFLIGLSLCFVPGMGALKRMVLIKGAQKVTGLKAGFVLALLLDIFWGSFQQSPLSFSYSFLFLGIIYSGVRGPGLVIWFFMGQLLLAYFQGNHISPLLLFLSPVLNFTFGLLMPPLFLLSFPLWDWQLRFGLWILGLVQKLVTAAFMSLKFFPSWEIHLGVILLLACLCCRRWKLVILALALLSNSLNLDLQRVPSASTYEFRPTGKYVAEKGDITYFTDGKCKFKLIRGHWYERCTPKGRRKAKNKKGPVARAPSVSNLI